MQKIKFQRGSIVSPGYLNETQKSIRFTEESRENYFSNPTDLEENSWEIGSRDGIKDWEIDRDSNIGRLAYSGRVLGTDPNSVAILYGPPSTTKFNAIRGENEEFLGLDSTSQLPLGSFGLIIESGSMVSPTGDAWTWGREYLITNGGVTRFGIFHGTDQELKLVEELPSRAIPFSLLFRISISVSGEITELIDLRPHTHIDNLYTYTQGLVNTQIINTDYTASSWERVIVDTRNGPITITLPSDDLSTDSDQITIVDAFNSFSTYPLIIRPDPETGILNNSVEDYFFVVSGTVVDLFFYDNPDEGLSTWKIKNNNRFTPEDRIKLDGIEEGAQVNVLSDWDAQNDTEPGFIYNKPDLSIYLTADSNIDGNKIIGNLLPLDHGFFTSATLTTFNTNPNQVVITLSATACRTVKFLVQVTSGSNYQSTELLTTHNGTTAFLTEYGTIETNSNLAFFDTDVSNNNLRLLVTPVNAVTTIKVIAQAIRI